MTQRFIRFVLSTEAKVNLVNKGNVICIETTLLAILSAISCGKSQKAF